MVESRCSSTASFSPRSRPAVSRTRFLFEGKRLKGDLSPRVAGRRCGTQRPEGDALGKGRPEPGLPRSSYQASCMKTSMSDLVASSGGADRLDTSFRPETRSPRPTLQAEHASSNAPRSASPMPLCPRIPGRPPRSSSRPHGCLVWPVSRVLCSGSGLRRGRESGSPFFCTGQ